MFLVAGYSFCSQQWQGGDWFGKDIRRKKMVKTGPSAEFGWNVAKGNRRELVLFVVECS
jgi:hypothetical protein